MLTLGTAKEVFEKDVQTLVPPLVFEKALAQAATLDVYYSSDRNILHDDGGAVVLLFGEADIAALQDQFGITKDCISEWDEPIGTQTEWYHSLFLLSNEYALSVLYPSVLFSLLRNP